MYKNISLRDVSKNGVMLLEPCFDPIEEQIMNENKCINNSTIVSVIHNFNRISNFR